MIVNDSDVLEGMLSSPSHHNDINSGLFLIIMKLKYTYKYTIIHVFGHKFTNSKELYSHSQLIERLIDQSIDPSVHQSSKQTIIQTLFDW